MSSVRRGLIAAAALAICAVLAGAGLTVPRAAAAPRADPTITIRVGGIRNALNGAGVPNATGLEGATFHVSPATPGEPDTCVSDASGLCVLNVAANTTYTVTQTGAPGGWFYNERLGGGAIGPPNTVVEYPYSTLSVPVAAADVTVSTPATNTNTSPTARSGTWAVSKDNPPESTTCGLRIALLIDLSSSITPTLLPTYKAAAKSFVSALEGTPSSIAIYTFGTTAPAPNTTGANNANLTPPVPVANGTGVDILNSKIDGLAVPANSYTNWDAGIFQIAQDNPLYGYQVAVVLTDGDPTRYGPSANLGGVVAPVTSRFAETENAVFSANALKNGGTTVLGVGIGENGPESLQYIENLSAISGKTRGTDYVNTDFAHLGTVLTNIALRNCAGLDITKRAEPRTFHYVGQPITFHYTVTNTKDFTLHDVHVTDDHIPADPDEPRQIIPCTPSTLVTNQTATCTATYHITQADLDRGYVANTAFSHGTTPNGDPVTSGPARARVTAQRRPQLSIVKTAVPPDFTTPGQVITYEYRVTNTGNVTMRDITVADDKIHGPATCPATTLEPNHYMICHATYTITAADVERGFVDNIATVAGDPPDDLPPVTVRTEDEIRVGVPVTG